MTDDDRKAEEIAREEARGKWSGNHGAYLVTFDDIINCTRAGIKAARLVEAKYWRDNFIGHELGCGGSRGCLKNCEVARADERIAELDADNDE